MKFKFLKTQILKKFNKWDKLPFEEFELLISLKIALRFKRYFKFYYLH
jgi:hypothetical protein